ncbi:MAG: porin [Deltaproteobacteria bacterium]|nr:porin [Deltaproteobacteria bacterium]
MASDTFAQDILIFSSSHSNTEESILTNKNGTLVVEISAFARITKIKVNGKNQVFRKKQRSTLKIPYNLKEGENEFEVAVETKEGSDSKEFVLVYEPSSGKKKQRRNTKAYQVVTIASLQQLDNVGNAPTDKKSGNKLTITVNPTYNYSLSKSSQLQVQGVFLRDKFLDTALADYEISFNQISLEWVKMKTKKSGGMSFGLGYNDITNKSAGFITGENQIETDLFLNGRYGLKFGKDIALDINGKITQIDASNETAGDNDADGLLYAFDLHYKQPFGDFNLGAKGFYDMADTKGKYQAYDRSGVEVTLGYPLMKKLMITGNYLQKKTVYIESEPDQPKESSTLTDYGLKGIYSFSKNNNLFGIAQYTNSSQDSNIQEKVFKSSAYSLSAVYIF